MDWLTHNEAVTVIAASIARSSPRRHPALAHGVERVVGLAGAAGVGKTSISRSLAALFGNLGDSCTHVALDGFLYPRAVRQQLGVNGYQLQGWRQDVAEETLRALLCDGKTVSIPEYLPDGTHGLATQVEKASRILLDGNYCLLGAIGELVDTLIFFDSNLATLKYLRYDRDVLQESRFTPEQEEAVWKSELEALQRNILPKGSSAQILVRLDRKRRYQVLVQ